MLDTTNLSTAKMTLPVTAVHDYSAILSVMNTINESNCNKEYRKCLLKTIVDQFHRACESYKKEMDIIEESQYYYNYRIQQWKNEIDECDRIINDIYHQHMEKNAELDDEKIDKCHNTIYLNTEKIRLTELLLSLDVEVILSLARER